MIGALSKARSLTFQNVDLLRERSLADSALTIHRRPPLLSAIVLYCPPWSLIHCPPRSSTVPLSGLSLSPTVLHCPLLSFTSPPTVRSNAKAIWANAHPMSSEELITKQAEMVYEAKPGVEGEMPRTFSF